MKRLFRNKLFLLFLFTILILVVMGVSSSNDSRLHYIRDAVNVPLYPVQKFFTFIGEKVEGTFTYFKDTGTLKEQNEKLQARIDELEGSVRDLDRYKKENDILRDTLKLKDRFKDYEPVGGNIIGKDVGNLFYVFTIDAGTLDGITVNSPVVTRKGLVGKVIEAGVLSSRVLSLIDPKSSVSGVNTRTMELIDVVRGDFDLKDKGLCRMEFGDEDIDYNDVIETSGISGIFPKGIVIGRVREIRQASNELDRHAVIEPAVDFKKLQEVFVLKRKTKK